MLKRPVAIYGVDVDAKHLQLRVAGLLNLGYYQALFLPQLQRDCMVCKVSFSMIGETV